MVITHWRAETLPAQKTREHHPAQLYRVGRLGTQHKDAHKVQRFLTGGEAQDRVPMSVSKEPTWWAGMLLRGQKRWPDSVFQQKCRAAVRGLVMDNSRRCVSQSHPVKPVEYKGTYTTCLPAVVHHREREEGEWYSGIVNFYQVARATLMPIVLNRG